MRFSPYKLLSLLLFCMLFACEDKEDSDSLELSTELVTLNTTANYGSCIVITPGAWSIEVPSSDSWCTVSPSQGEGQTEVRIKGTVNIETSPRETLLTVTSGSISRNIRVVQPGAELSLDTEPLLFPAEGKSLTTTIHAASNIEWSITEPSDKKITVSPLSGKGTKEITITLGANPLNKEKNTNLTVKYNGQKAFIPIQQAAGPNNPPIAPALTLPANEANGTSRVIEFKWQATYDPDQDPVTYKVAYSTDGQTWIYTPEMTSIKWKMNEILQPNTKYYWKVIASDDLGKSIDSDIFTFTTNDKEILMDGSYTQYQGAGLNGTIPIIFVGEGFTISDYEVGGHFDKKIDEGIEHFFSTEPYKSYRNQFKVYKVVAHSEESGASRWNDYTGQYTIKKNTAFDTKYYGDGYTSTYMTTNDTKVYQYAKKIYGVTEKVLQNTTIVLVVNDPIYSGTCWSFQDGRSVAIVPTCDERQPYSYQATMIHEAGGHGFGRLGDEYEVVESGAAPPSAINGIVEWSKYGFNSNLDVTGDPTKVKWKHFIGRPGYESVRCVSGAQYPGGGVWMPENASVMRIMTDANIYYNAPSREAIVKRIMVNLGQPYSLDEFIQKDKGQRSAAPRVSTRGEHVLRPTAHTPPQIRK